MNHEFYVNILIFFIGVSLLLYTLFGGADYGAGILELFKGETLRDEQEDLIGHAIGPVWEANHIWLILIVVILFYGFPTAYTTISIYLHLPLMAVLVGIVLRGTAFAFRHYDAIQDEVSQTWYTRIFAWSSLWTSIWIGITAGALINGGITENTTDFWTLYVSPWLNLFSLTMGLFFASVFTFLASVYLIGESQDTEIRNKFTTRAFWSNIATVVSGGLLFSVSEFENVHLLEKFLKNPLSIFAGASATLSLALLWRALNHKNIVLSRLIGGFQVLMILLGLYSVTYPNLLILKERNLNFYEVAAPLSSIKYLSYALFGGITLIFPALFYLFWVFKASKYQMKR